MPMVLPLRLMAAADFSILSSERSTLVALTLRTISSHSPLYAIMSSFEISRTIALPFEALPLTVQDVLSAALLKLLTASFCFLRHRSRASL